jgi:hypothetical protein
MTDWVLGIGLKSCVSLGAPLATKFTYKMRLGGKGMWGRGPALCKQNYFQDKIPADESASVSDPDRICVRPGYEWVCGSGLEI